MGKIVDEFIYDAIAELIKDETSDVIEFATSRKQKAPIRITFRDNLIDGENSSFQTRFTRDLLEIFNNKVNLTDRILKDQTPSKKSSRKNSINVKHILDSIMYDIDIPTNRKSTVGISEKELSKLDEEDIITLMLEVIDTWNSFSALRTSRRFNDRHVYGYLKTRKSWSHDELLKAIQTYGKWGTAYDKAIKAGEDHKIFWFHPWSLDQFLRSNTAMDHVTDGWKQLVRDKKIPDEYSGIEEERPKYRGINQE